MEKKKSKSSNYVDNVRLYDEIVKYQERQRIALETGKDRPRIPEYIGKSILQISEGFCSLYKYTNYPFKEDMIQDGVLNCLQYIDNFDTEAYKNPHAYFTKIIWYAVLRRIQGEKKHLYLKYALQRNSDSIDIGTFFDEGNTAKGKIYSEQTFLDIDKMNNFMDDYERYMSKKSKPKNKKDEIDCEDIIID